MKIKPENNITNLLFIFNLLRIHKKPAKPTRPPIIETILATDSDVPIRLKITQAER